MLCAAIPSNTAPGFYQMSTASEMSLILTYYNNNNNNQNKPEKNNPNKTERSLATPFAAVAAYSEGNWPRKKN